MKKLLILLLFLLFGLGFSNVNAAGKTSYNIITNPGENLADSVRINYHTDVMDTFVEFTLASDAGFASATRVDGQYENWKAPVGANIVGFGDRYRVKVSLENLTPATKYIYRVGKVGDFSATYSFSTAKEGDFTFLHITDPQYYSTGTAAIFNNLMNTAFNKNPDIAFTFFTGDIIDKGGDESQWDMFYDKSSLKRQVIASVPGNHEYYDAHGPGSYFGQFFDINNNNPENGPAEHLNNTFYFRYNNTLFIGLNSESNKQSLMKPWFEEVVKNNSDADFIVVGMHRSMYGSTYAGDSVAVRNNWLELFDRYGVDLVLSGHDHIYARSLVLYNGAQTLDPIKGTTYIIGGAGGSKFYPAVPNKLYAHYIENTSVANIITVTDKEITINLINQAGATLDTLKDQNGDPAPIRTKRVGEKDAEFSKANFARDIVVEKSKSESTIGTITWPKNAYKNVINMEVRHFDLDYVIKQAYMYNPNINTFNFSGVNANRINKFKVVITYADLSQDVLTYEIDTVLPIEPIRYRIGEALEKFKNEFDLLIQKVYKNE